MFTSIYKFIFHDIFHTNFLQSIKPLCEEILDVKLAGSKQISWHTRRENKSRYIIFSPWS